MLFVVPFNLLQDRVILLGNLERNLANKYTSQVSMKRNGVLAPPPIPYLTLEKDPAEINLADMWVIWCSLDSEDANGLGITPFHLAIGKRRWGIKCVLRLLLEVGIIERLRYSAYLTFCAEIPDAIHQICISRATAISK